MMRGGRRALLVAGLVAAGVAGSFGSSSASPAARPASTVRAQVAPEAVPRAAAPAAPQAALPTDEHAAFISPVGIAASARASRAKIIIKVPALYTVAYLLPSYSRPGRVASSAPMPVPAYYRPAHPLPQCRYYQSVLQVDLFAVNLDDPVRTKPGIVRSVGQFPDTKVSLLAFGSIPVTAVLHTSQAYAYGRMVPLTADSIISYFSILANDPAGANGAAGCDPQWEANEPPNLSISTALLNASVSDVRVDGEPVDVGTACHTVTPLKARLLGEPPAYVNPFNGGTLTQTLDRSTVTKAGSTYPLYPGSSDLTVPPFVGCRNPATGEDLSRLITAMVSGPGNTLEVSQSLAPTTTPVDPLHPTECPPNPYGAILCATLPKNPTPPQPGK